MPSTPLLGAYGSLANTSISFKNVLINGGFDIWQRGGSLGPFTDEQYVADRWRIIKNDTVNYSVSQLAFTLGQTDVPDNPRFYHRLTCNSIGAANDFAITAQRLENVVLYSGMTMTLSFWAKASVAFTINPAVGTNRGAVGILQNFGSGGSPSASVLTTIQQSQAVTTTWTKYTYTFTVPSVSGKTLGTTANSSYLEIYMFPLVAGNAGRFIDIANVQLEAGPVATPFEQRPIGTELALCQRYYEVFPSVAIGAVNGYNNYGYMLWMFKVTKRAVPIVPVTSALQYPGGISRTVSADSTRTDATNFIDTAGGGGTNYTFTASASAEL